METALNPKIPTPKGLKGELAIIQFVPQGSLSRDTKKTIRSHVMLDTRRKQRQRKQLLLQPRPTQVINRRFEDTLCRCDILYPGSYTESMIVADARSRPFGKSQLLADSFKMCPKCRLVQFSKLSMLGQLRIANAEPLVSTFLQLDWDPFNTLPTLTSTVSSTDNRDMNELKSHS